MRTLRFIIEDLIIRIDPNCNFDDLVPGTEGYLKAEFSFSPEWNGCKKVAGFYSRMGKEFSPKELLDGKSCIIPNEALKHQIFRIQVIGKKDGLKLTTNKLIVNQNGGRK